jgi:hypothetical protein
MDRNFLYVAVFYKDSCLYEKSTFILHLYRNISGLVYNINIRQYASGIAVKRMRFQALSKHDMQMYVGIVTLNKLHVLNNLLD